MLRAALLELVHSIPGSIHQLAISRLLFDVFALPHGGLCDDTHSAAYLGLGWRLVRIGVIGGGDTVPFCGVCFKIMRWNPPISYMAIRGSSRAI